MLPFWNIIFPKVGTDVEASDGVGFWMVVVMIFDELVQKLNGWTIPFHSTAVKAAGAIHSDFEKKFIRAEVVNWKSLVELGGYGGLREKGLLRLEGKEYIVKDGDVLVIRHG